jgi:hypothetical protein
MLLRAVPRLTFVLLTAVRIAFAVSSGQGLD